jgi:error-prone DNA polymerase
MIGGLSEDAARRIVGARPFESVESLARRAALNRKDLRLLAQSGALASIAGHRRQAHWKAAGIPGGTPDLLAAAPVLEPVADLAPPGEGENLVADYASLGLTLGRHPLALLRERLGRMRFLTAEVLRQIPHGRHARAAGLVTCRQRPDTASGVVFVTLEDETGYVNVVVWRDLVDSQRQALLGASLLAVDGTIEREGEVVHLVARRLADHSALLGRLAASSRDFH